MMKMMWSDDWYKNYESVVFVGQKMERMVGMCFYDLSLFFLVDIVFVFAIMFRLFLVVVFQYFF